MITSKSNTLHVSPGNSSINDINSDPVKQVHDQSDIRQTVGLWKGILDYYSILGKCSNRL